MRRLIALFLIIAMLTGCASTAVNTAPSADRIVVVKEPMPDFSGIDDRALLRYLEDTVYTELIDELGSNNYFIENVHAIYISKEYLEESLYNSKENIYFGYTLSELDACFQGVRYNFTLGENGQTEVVEFQEYEDVYAKMLEDVAVGAGVILLCVTVSAFSGNIGLNGISMIFAASAKRGAEMGLSAALFSGVSAGFITGIQTGDMGQAIKAAIVTGGESFRWGAIGGAIEGGNSMATELKGATLNNLSINDAANIQSQSGYPIDVIKKFQSMEQYLFFRNAGIKPEMVNGKIALIRKIDLNYTDESGVSNLQKMQAGLAPSDPTGVEYELHHLGQRIDSTLIILTREEHRQLGNYNIWHNDTTEKPSSQKEWDKICSEFWIRLAELMRGAS